MAAETAREFESLEAQAQKLMAVFIDAGYEAVAPSLIQPANVYLDVIGEALRARSYVFVDPEGDELCLRPDLTVPTCRLHAERIKDGSASGKYCYNGPAFRYQPQGADKAHPREFRQSGIELFGDNNTGEADAEVLALLVEGVRQCGLEDWRLRFGDLGLFGSLLDSVEMPDRWRQRLRRQFWRPKAFRDELMRLTEAPAKSAAALPPALVEAIDLDNPDEAPQIIERYFEESGISIIGARTIGEISENVLTLIADAKADPLPKDAAQLIESYLEISAPARAAGARVKDLVREGGVDISAALDTYFERLQFLADAGIDVVQADFSTEFGRTLEYYSGFVFEILVPSLAEDTPVAGGGRYDGLVRMCGADEDVPAVGGAIHTERLLAAVNGQEL